MFSLQEISIQTIAACNIKCKVCPNAKRPNQYSALRKMDETVFKRIINEFEDFSPKAKRKTVRLFLQNEPLLDPRLVERIKYVKKHIENSYVIITTNAVLLEPKLSEKLLNAGLDALNISFLGLYKRTVDKMQPGGDYFSRLGNILHFLRLRKKINPKIKVGANVILSDSVQEDEAWAMCSFWRDAGIDEIETWGRPSSRAGSIGKKKKYLKSNAPFSCKGFTVSSSSKGAWGMLGFLCNGDAVFCFNDYERRHTLGNIKTASLGDIWKNKERLMNRALNGTASNNFICRYCEFAGVLQ